MTHLVCTGGGTAGHVLPALPVMERALAAGWQVTFVGSRSGFEERLLAGLPVRYAGVTTGKLRRYLASENLVDAFRVLVGMVQALLLLRRLRPDVVFSKGGFVSFPVVFAAGCLRIPVLAHESDLSPGLANRMALPFVSTLAVTFPGTHLADFRGRQVVAGSPLRPLLRSGQAARGRAWLGVPADRPLLLVTGGSLGADRLNRALIAALPELLPQFAVIHVCGPGKRSEVDLPGYRAFEFVRDEWGDVLAAADLVVSRAGANTLFELLALRKPALLVPLSARASRGDQLENAAWAVAAGYCRSMQDDGLDGAALAAAVGAAWSARVSLTAALATFEAPDAAAVLWSELERLRLN
ncbi:MAG: UDP-N-acetylglucosamine--N-acetylmuramyl-(pentapeptide) pyrophosphoryl-undecaprenol N-acetylglucosamine transferase [Pseudomonadales bacterium]